MLLPALDIMTSPQLIRVTPQDVLVFAADTRTAYLTVHNLYSASITYIVRTKFPEMYSVSPSRGELRAQESVQVLIRLKEVGREAGPKQQFQVVGTTAEGLSSVVKLKVEEGEENASQFVTSVLAEEPVEDVENTKANMQELQAQSLKTIKELDHMRMEIQRLEHQLRFKGESKLQALDNSGYSLLHLLIGFIAGFLLAAIAR